MQNAAQAYSRTAQVAVSPRQLEASLLMRAATRLQNAKDGWQPGGGDLSQALYYNRKLWSVLVTAATRDENPLPHQIKQNIANLAVFVFKRTLDVEMAPEQAKLDILISINRQIAAGLEGM